MDRFNAARMFSLGFEMVQRAKMVSKFIPKFIYTSSTKQN
jgi:hypothetical protein